MGHHIDRDKKRFKDIIRGKVKQDFQKYIVNPEWIIQKGKGKYALPMPSINAPKFVHDPQQMGGVGMGEGEEDDAVGNLPAEHGIDYDVSLEELVKFLCEDLELPRLENKGKKNMPVPSPRYNSVSRVGPRSLAIFKRSYKEALKRAIMEGVYAPGMPPIIEKKDLRYKAPKFIEAPDPSAVIIYSMDTSGSMDAQKKEIVRTLAFWIDKYVRSQYKHVEERYIAHDATAKEVDEYEFYHRSSAGGTRMSSALELSDKLIEDEFPPSEWNIYVYQFSDGENWSDDDTAIAIDRIKKMLSYINQYAYGEVGKDGSFKQWLDSAFESEEKVILARILEKDQCRVTLKEFLGKGH